MAKKSKLKAVSTKQWFQLFDDSKGKLKVIFDRYELHDVWQDLMQRRAEKNQKEMLSILNRLWFELPDHIYNIIENPEGFQELLNLVEN
jgi:hypothetical protein